MSSRLLFSSAFAKRMAIVAVLVGTIIALVLPTAYAIIEWQEVNRNAALRNEELVDRIRRSVQENPELWYYNVTKFIEFSSDADSRHSKISSVRIYDARNELKHVHLIRNRPFCTVVSQAPIQYNNEVYGRIEISDCVQDIINSTLILLVVCTMLGISIGSFVYKYPVYMVRVAEQEVQVYTLQAKQQADDEIARLDRLSVIGKMAAAIGHEIRNPLTTVKGYLQHFSGKKEFLAVASQFDLMIEELDRANSIITEFLNLAHNKSVCMKQCQLNQIIMAMYPLLESDAAIRGMNIELELKDIPEIVADEKEIRQLILNITRNGLEAMQTHGTLTIRTLRAQGSVLLQIVDQGSGIDAQIFTQLGTPFLTTKETGTGLGLAVCYSIANRHNAKIDFSTGSSGTTCTIQFPLAADFRQQKTSG